VRPAPTFGKPVTIPFETTPETAAVKDPWESVEPVFRDYRGDTADRDAEGAAKLRYTDRSGRNDIVLAKIARDEKYVYFMVETADALTPQSDRNWMQLFLSVGEESGQQPSWHRFQFIVNRNAPEDPAATKRTVLERSTGGWNWERAGEADCRVTGNRLELRIERSALGLSPDKPICLRFKWADNGFRPENEEGADTPDILDFHKYGDAAPDGRFSFQIQDED